MTKFHENEPQKILIAEDDKTAQRLLCKVCNSLGFATVLAADGQRAIQVIEDNPDIALLITDMLMPVVDGRGLVTWLRSQQSDIPVIMVSAFVGPKQISDLLELGASRFLPKPVDVMMLKDYIRSLLKKRMPAAPNPSVPA